jgi:hypothetical protein
MAPQARPWVTGYYQLVLDGIDVGIVQKLRGADADDGTIAMQLGLSMGQPVKDWIDASLSMDAPRKVAVLRLADGQRKVKQVIELDEALITEIGFPAADANARDVGYMTIGLAAGRKRMKQGDGSTIDDPSRSTQHLVLPESFRLHIDGLDETCARVTRVEPLTITRSVDGALIPGKLEMPNLTITFPAEASRGIDRWNGPKTGSLAFFDAAGRRSLLTLGFEGLGLVRVERDDRAGTATAEMVCERITIKEWLA